MNATRQKVKASQLLPGMIIYEISELSFDYSTLDKDGLKFVQSNFKGATAVIQEDGSNKEVPVTNLKEFDHLSAITNIPSDLKVATVVAGIGNLLEKHGLLEFMVHIPADGPSVPELDAKPQAPGLAIGSDGAKKRHQENVTEARQFLETIESAAKSREVASESVEEMLDMGRSGKFSSKGVEAVISDILEKGSTPAMKAIAGLRGSDQTYAHCTDMSVILQNCYNDILVRTGKEPTEKVSRFALLSGFMHDIGKSEVPKDILESNARFAPDSREMLLLRNHTTYGAKILSDMGMHDTIINVAHFHHVKKDDTLLTSYPEASYDNVKPMTRLASIVDVYQALIGKRKYKKNWVPGKAVEFILSIKDVEFDENMLNHFLQSIGRYPVGSLLRLSTGDLGFVVTLAPKEFQDRPMVVVVENKAGEMIGTPQIVDLMLDKDITVEEVIDHYEHYNETDDQAYELFRSLRI